MKHLFSRIRRWYSYNLPLHSKLLISHMTLILLPMLVLTVFFYGRLYDALVTDAVRSEQALTEQTVSTLDATLSSISLISNSVRDSINRFPLFQPNMVPETGELQNFSDNVNSLVDGTVVTGIKIYLSNDFAPYFQASLKNNVFASAKNISTAYWYGIFSSTQIQKLWCPALYLTPQEHDDNTLAYIVCLPHAAGTDARVCIAIYFSQAGIDSILQQNSSVANSAAYILNGRDAIVSSSSASLAGAYSMSNQYLLSTVGGLNRYAIGTYLDQDIYIGYYGISNSDWQLVSVLPADDLAQKGRLMVFQFVAFYLLFNLLALAFSLALSRSITRRLTRVADQMKTVETGTPIPMPPGEPSQDEIGVLTDSYNYMANEINDLLSKQAQTSKALQMSEFKALQAQINPHFLYNSLDMINWLSLAGDSEHVTQAIRALSRFYKLTLSRKDNLGTVAQELEHISLYVQLQNMRFDNCIRFIVDVPDDLLESEIPKLTFQPIIENSIIHGILEKPEKRGCITLTAWHDGADAVFTITDDGVGMEESVCANILSDSEKTEGHTNIGIYNTHARLQLIYGPGYGLHYNSVPGHGTDVEIRLPNRLHTPD